MPMPGDEAREAVERILGPGPGVGLKNTMVIVG